jgi:hypothetical protein
LNPAQKEIHKLTDIHFHYKPLKTGRKYTALRFYISSRPAPHQQAAEIREIPADTVRDPGKAAPRDPANGSARSGAAGEGDSGVGKARPGPDVKELVARHRTGVDDTDYTGRWDAQQLIKYYRRNVLGIDKKQEIPEALVTRAADLLRDFPALREGYFEQMDALARKKIRLELEAFLREETVALILSGEWDSLATQTDPGTGVGGVGESDPEADLEITWDQGALAAVRRFGSESRLNARQKTELEENLAKLHPGIERIFDHWDACCPWGKTKSRSKNRKDRFAQHVAESETFRENWREAIENAGKSKFMRGENSRKQKFAINCLLNEEFLEKLIEGQFNG